MRIFFVLEHLGGKGGVETVVKDITQKLNEYGHETFVFLPDPSDDITWENEIKNVYYYAKNTNVLVSSVYDLIFNRILGLSNLVQILGKPDIIIATHVPQTVLYSKFLVGTNTIPIVSWLHSPPEIFSNPYFINYADVHWAISKYIEMKIRDLLMTHDKVFWVGNPVNLNAKKISVKNNARFLYIGRLENKEKRIDVLIQALSRVKQPWQLDIYGDGPDRNELNKLAENLGINDFIQWHGWVKNPWEDIQNVTALILTSEFEGFGMAVLEALARGIPVISTDSYGVRDLIFHGKNGWLVPKDNVIALTRQIEKIILLPQNELFSFSNNACDSIGKFAIENVLDRMKESLSSYIAPERWNF